MAKVDLRRNRKKVKKPLTKAQRKKLADKMKGNKNSVGNAGGRPTVYTTQIGKKVRDMLMAMFSVDKIAGILEVSKDTLYEWKKTIPEFSDFWEYGVNGVDHAIVRSLSKRAAGFKKRVEKPIKTKDEQGFEKIVNHKYVEYHPPDTRAIEMWLRNRSNLKKDWSNLPPEDQPPPPQPTVNINQIDLSKLDDATIKKLLAAIKPGNSEG
jgi:hypothetical protein